MRTNEGVDTYTASGGILGAYGQSTHRKWTTDGPAPFCPSDLEAFRAADGGDLIRDSVRVALLELVELKASGTHFFSAPNERTETQGRTRRAPPED